MVLPTLKGLSRAELLALDPEHCRRILTKEELEMIFMACDAFWQHPGKKKPQAPHAVLTRGKHSDFYINCPEVLERSNLCQIMAQQLVFRLSSFYNGRIDWVIGSDSSALGLSKDVANLFKAKWRPMQKGPDGTQVWEKGIISPREKVLHIEELVTTSGTSQAVRDGIKKDNPYPVDFIPFIPVLVMRPDKDAPEQIDGSQFISCLHYKTYTVDPGKQICEYCQNDSPALPAKENWNKLMKSM